MQLWGGGGGGGVGGGVIRTLPLEKSHSIKVNKNMHWTTPDKQIYPSVPAPYVYTWKKSLDPHIHELLSRKIDMIWAINR